MKREIQTDTARSRPAALATLIAIMVKEQQAIVQATNVPVGQVHYFQYPTTEDPAILLHLTDGRFVAYSGRCTHLSCAVYYDQPSDKLLCPCHEGVFDPRTGSPIAGPPQRSLPRISLKQDGTMLYAVEEVPGE